jgi:ACS family hexuronate transporter-like MFS transporter
MLLAFRVLLGVMESGNWPGAMRIVSRALPPQERAMGNGIFTSGTSVGALIAPALIYCTSSIVGWRASFAVLGATVALWFGAWVLATRGPHLQPVWRSEPSERRQPAAWGAYRNVLANPQFWRVFCVTILVNPVLYFFLNWLPTYYRQQHSVAPGPRQAKILTLTFLGLDLGYLACGAGVLFLVRKGISLRSARRAVFLTASLLMASAGLAPLVRNFAVVVVLLIMAVFAAGVWISMYLTLAQEVSPESVSTAAGLLGGSGSLAGALLMWAVGKVTQATGAFTAPLFAVTCIAVLAATAGWYASRATPSGHEQAAR